MSRPPLIVQPLPLDAPAGAAPDLLLMSADRRKKKQKEKSKTESSETEDNHLYGIVSSPSDASPRLTLKISRVKSAEADQTIELSQQSHAYADHQGKSEKDSKQLPRADQDLLQDSGAVEQPNCQQVPVWSTTKDSSTAATADGAAFDDAEMDPLAEMERLEREAATEKERWSKEVQDKGSVWPQCSCI